MRFWTTDSALLTEYQDGESVELESIGLSISVKGIYANVAGKLFND